jgi:hypothetical protein
LRPQRKSRHELFQTVDFHWQSGRFALCVKSQKRFFITSARQYQETYIMGFATTQEPYESSGMIEPVNVIGMSDVSSMSTQLVNITYALSADRIAPVKS